MNRLWVAGTGTAARFLCRLAGVVRKQASALRRESNEAGKLE